MRGLLRVGSLVTALSFVHSLAVASGGSESGTSEGSANSSGQSSDSSEGSQESSRDSSGSSNEENSRQSTTNSSEATTDQTTEGLSKGEGGAILSVIGAVVLLGGVVAVGVVLTVRSGRDEEAAEAKLMHYLQRQHALVAHDIAVAEGPVLASWTQQLGLSDAERARFLRALDGSAEQGEMLRALSAGDGRPQARRFAEQFSKVLSRAVGQVRAQEAATRLVAAR